MKTPWEIHECILADIAEHSPNVMPAQITISEDGEIPSGVYEPSKDGVWTKIREYQSRVPRTQYLPDFVGKEIASVEILNPNYTYIKFTDDTYLGIVGVSRYEEYCGMEVPRLSHKIGVKGDKWDVEHDKEI